MLGRVEALHCNDSNLRNALDRLYYDYITVVSRFSPFFFRFYRCLETLRCNVSTERVLVGCITVNYGCITVFPVFPVFFTVVWRRCGATSLRNGTRIDRLYYGYITVSPFFSRFCYRCLETLRCNVPTGHHKTPRFVSPPPNNPSVPHRQKHVHIWPN